ncbi:hypothetical protein A8C56_10835 [Niabella ginsenosidivorans]|uniref:Adenylosuccinate lyase n=1 Tax=Niabella ginsenosidivorans TaxID=1176587 RepID=A0A1A9I3Z9_9BACT|nr:hypothetical protein [Niabella ginsenosidivorans]ANH81412.1 hypothetical protein A8C56_10835 [Niabella ginsenosidivorans]
MDLQQQLSASITKEQVMAIVNWVGDSRERFDELFRIFTTSPYRIVQRAAWPMSYCVIRHPSLIAPHYTTLLRLLDDAAQPPAVKRNILRLLDQGAAIPKKFHGRIMDICFRNLEDPTGAIAAKAFSIGVLSKLSDLYPEILPELKTTAELLLPHASPGVKSRALKVLKKKRGQ